MKKELVNSLSDSFESHKYEEDGVEFWFARELQELLQYDTWRRFSDVIERARVACKNSKQKISDHFAGADKMVLSFIEAKK